jgi:hypothetical protein
VVIILDSLDSLDSVEICICGHKMLSHSMLGTDYVRCKTHPWHCYCLGDARVAVLVTESMSSPSAVQSNGRFFRSLGRTNIKHPLTHSLENISERGVSWEWAFDSCEGCGLDVEDVGENLTVVSVGVDGESVLYSNSEIRKVLGKSRVVCDLCLSEIQWLSRM